MKHPEYMGVWCPTCKQDCLPHRGRCMFCDSYVQRWLYGTYKTANSAHVRAHHLRKRGLRAKAHGLEIWVEGEKEAVAA